MSQNGFHHAQHRQMQVNRRNDPTDPPLSRSRDRQFSVEDDQPSPDENLHVPTAEDLGEGNDMHSVHSEESFTLRDRQNAINKTHPFGIRLWKPALYKKTRSVERNAEEDILSAPGRYVPWAVHVGNLIWTATFGLCLWVTLIAMFIPLKILGYFSTTAQKYATLCRKLAFFFLWPFGKYVELVYSEDYHLEDDGQGRPIADYLAWQDGTDEQPSRLFFAPRTLRQVRDLSRDSDEGFRYFRPFGRGDWTFARVLYFALYYVLLLPVGMCLASICWLSIVGVPMARVIVHMMYHMRVHPLEVSVRRSENLRDTQESMQNHAHSIILCTYRAFGFKYFKYTVGGTNVVLFNMIFIVFVTLFDSYFFFWLSDSMHFFMALISIIPLAHFIGQAVASISAQSSMSMGATVNAFFSTLVEVFLYLVALRQGKGELVEGSITGSVLAGVLLMPGLSMCAGAFKQKTQKFNPKSAGATSTMLLFTIAGVIAPTVFLGLYGPSETYCEIKGGRNLCWQTSAPLSALDARYHRIVRPFSFLCAICLFITYAIGLMFTLRTHAAMIWANTGDEDEGDGEEGANWGYKKSYAILLSATFLYAAIAEVLVNSVDGILEHVNISQRILGLTIFALVPNTAEFLNAISFAINGNVALSLEIGSAYALQVCLLQIPALVFFSQGNVANHVNELRDYVFVLLFPRWDTWAWIVSILLFCHVHSEGRSNYFKGSILLLAYTVLTAGFYFNDVIRQIFPSADLYIS